MSLVREGATVAQSLAEQECTRPTVYSWLPPQGKEKRSVQAGFLVAVGLKEAVKVQRREQESLLQ